MTPTDDPGPAPLTAVIGATGRVGGEVVRALLERGHPVRPTSSRADAVAQHRPTALLDWTAPSTWGAALHGVARLLLVLPEVPSLLTGGLHTALRRAVDGGLHRVVLVSALGVGEEGDSTGMAEVEEVVRTCGAAWTVLRPNTFMQNLTAPPLVGPVVDRGELIAPVGEARVSVVDVRDVAAVAAAALVQGGLAGRTLTLTGPQSLTFAEIAATMSGATGRTVTHVDPGADGMRSLLLGAGLPPPAADLVLSFYDGLRSGRHATITGDVAEAVGRAPRSFAAFAAGSAEAWRPRRPSTP